MTKSIGVLEKGELLHYSGKEFLEKMVRGELPQPPFSHSMNMVITELSDGFVIFEAKPDIKFYNAIGCVHGGYISTILDSAMACAIQTKLPAKMAFTTLELKVNFIRPVFSQTGPIYAHGKMIHVGRTTATAEGKLYDQKGKLYAFGTTTCALMAAHN